jgi:ribonuclease HI
METFLAYTAGEAHGNPGPAAIGVSVTTKAGDVVEEVHKAIGNGTDNFAEYYAVVVALDTLKQIYGDKTTSLKFDIMLDSVFVHKQLVGESPIKEPGLVGFFIEIHNQQVASFPHLTFTVLPREHNQAAHRLVQEALSKQ